MQALMIQGAGFRTKLMQEEAAERFARCLRGNPRFDGVSVLRSPRAAGDKAWYVAYTAADPGRRLELLQGHQDARTDRALAEGSGYRYVLDTDGLERGRPFFWCLSVSGEVYEVTEDDCTCPDYQYRAKHCGLKCKHMIALGAGVAPVEVLEAGRAASVQVVGSRSMDYQDPFYG